MGTEIFEEIGALIAEKTYKSTFDFEKWGISSRDKEYIIKREETIVENVKKQAKSLYEICKAVYEIRLAMKGDDSASFVEWYTHNGLTKDKVSELTKRYELYIQAPDKIEYITNLSIPAVKELTRKNIDVDVQIDAMEKELKRTDEIKQFVASKKNVGTQKEKGYLKIPPHINKLMHYYEDNVKPSKTPQELAALKKEIKDIQKYLKGLENKLEQWEEETAKANNLKIIDIEEAETV